MLKLYGMTNSFDCWLGLYSYTILHVRNRA